MCYVRLRAVLAAVALLTLALPPARAQQQTMPDFLDADGEKTKIMLLGTFHFANPGRDQYQPKYEVNILSEERQKQVRKVLRLIEAYRPNRIAVEPPDTLTDPANVLTFFSLVTDAPSATRGVFRGAFYEVFRPRWVTSTDTFTGEALPEALAAPASTVVLLTGASPKAQQRIREQLPALSQLPPGPYAYTLVDGSHPVLLLRAEAPEQLQTILEEIRRKGLTLHRYPKTR